jgi:hypothetical protein
MQNQKGVKELRVSGIGQASILRVFKEGVIYKMTLGQILQGEKEQNQVDIGENVSSMRARGRALVCPVGGQVDSMAETKSWETSRK